MQHLRCFSHHPEAWHPSNYHNYKMHFLQCFRHFLELWYWLSCHNSQMHNLQCWSHPLQSQCWWHLNSSMQGFYYYYNYNSSSLLFRWCSVSHLHTVSRSGCLRSNKYIPFPQPYRNLDNNGRRNSRGLFQSVLMRSGWWRFCGWEQEW